MVGQVEGWKAGGMAQRLTMQDHGPLDQIDKGENKNQEHMQDMLLDNTVGSRQKTEIIPVT